MNTTDAKSTRYGMWQLKKLQREFDLLKDELFGGGMFAVFINSNPQKRYAQLLGYFFPQYRNDEWEHPLGTIARDGDEVVCQKCGETCLIFKPEKFRNVWHYDCDACQEWYVCPVAGYTDPADKGQCVLLVKPVIRKDKEHDVTQAKKCWR